MGRQALVDSRIPPLGKHGVNYNGARVVTAGAQIVSRHIVTLNEEEMRQVCSC
jgi:hypothetical protein